MSIATDSRIRKVAQLLTQRNLVSFARLESVYAEHKDAGGVAFLHALVASDELNAEMAAEIIASSFGVKLINPDAVKVNEEVRNLIPAQLARRCMAVPLEKRGNTLLVAMADPMNMANVDMLRKAVGMDIDVNVASATHILAAIGQISTDIHGGDSGDAPATTYVDKLFIESIKNRATDIHLEPSDGHVNVRFRIDGILYHQEQPATDLYPAIVSRIKILGQMDIGERRLPQAGRVQDVVEGKEYDMRVSTFPTTYGENVVIRILAAEGMMLSLADLGFPDTELGAFNELIRRPNGILLVTGPTGSGKSTTLYASLNTINRPEINIHTLEDPVESRLEGIRQTQMNNKVGLTFARSLRDILRQDPDVVMIGEIRDVETATTAIHASLTGHLVFSTLHTNSAAGAVSRLDNMEIEPFLVASSLIGIVAQRLVRTLCMECREKDPAAEERLVEIGDLPAGTAVTTFREMGCPKCHNTGYSGRRGIFELLVPDADIQKMTIQQKSSQEIEALAVERGMTTLWRAGMQAVAEGMTTLAEVMRVAH